MPGISSDLGNLKQSLFGTPEWALKKIRKARQENSTYLDLSRMAVDDREKLTAFPEEILELSNLRMLYLSNNIIETLPPSISRLQNLVYLDLRSTQLESLPSSIGYLQNLATLLLGGNLLGVFPEAISHLPNLVHLDLSRNGFNVLPTSIHGLQKLADLSLSGNGLRLLPKALAQLQNLTHLNLSSVGLTDLPEWVSQLQNLQSLDLGNNKLRTLPDTLADLKNLTMLELSGNELEELPEVITHLPNLIELYLRGIRLRTFPESITRLQTLTILDLSVNLLVTFPEVVTHLSNLTWLNLERTGLQFVSESIARLSNLTTLNLNRNQVRSLPHALSRMQNLTTLILSYNQIESFPEELLQIQSLKRLVLSHNRIERLPETITQLPELIELKLISNPLVSPPSEIANKGIEAIREYFRQVAQEGVDHLYEAKLLILGEGGAGKTTFANKILNSDYDLKDEESTRGVDVLQWSFPLDDGRQFRVNLWDFGGQEIYHATHQFFLTRRSLYILVADTRKDDTDFYYWLNVAELLSDGSPLLIVKNEKQDRHRELNERQLRGQFESLKEVLATNLATNRGLAEVREEIRHYIRRLPHIGAPLPKTWVRVRAQLERDPRNYISLEEYLSICRDNGFGETKDSLQLSGYLHDIGVFLHFQDEPLLKKTILLKPKWGTDAVYKVLDNPQVIRQLGCFTHGDLAAIWDAPEYAHMSDELLQLMMKFKLCYEIPTRKGAYIAPQLLTENQPDYPWEARENLLLRYTYEFMPKGILTQFIVVMHPYILEQKHVWKSGIVIEKEGTRAEVIEHYGKREIHIRVAGPQARDLLTVIRHELEQIHAAYRRLKYAELVRCNCSACRESPDPHFYPVAELQDFRANNQLEIQCRRKPYQMVNVMKLLGDVIDLEAWAERKDPLEVNIENYYATGDNLMTRINQTIDRSTIQGSVVAAKSIRESFNALETAEIQAELKDLLKQLAQAVEALSRELPQEKAEEVAEDMQVLVQQAAKEKPNPRWYTVSLDGLIAAAQNLGQVGDAVIDLAGKVRTILTGGLL